MRALQLHLQSVTGDGREVIVASGDIDNETFDFGDTLRTLPLVIHRSENGEVTEYSPNRKLYEEDSLYQASRKKKIMEIAREFEPDVVVFEFFPLVPKQFRVPDMEALLEYRQNKGGNLPFVTIARDSTLVDGIEDEMRNDLLKNFDHILLRGWKEISWGSEFDVKGVTLEKLGHVLDKRPANDNSILPQERPVIVFASGGYQDDKLFFEKAIEACKKSVFANQPWKIVVSDECPDKTFAELQRKAAGEEKAQVSRLPVPITMQNLQKIYRPACARLFAGVIMLCWN